MRPPKPERDVPADFELVPHVDMAWEAVNSARGCRWMEAGRSCAKPTVARLNRSRDSRQRWFYYCGEHMYGRWVEDGRVMSWWAEMKERA